jgi:hypothetical protein
MSKHEWPMPGHIMDKLGKEHAISFARFAARICWWDHEYELWNAINDNSDPHRFTSEELYDRWIDFQKWLSEMTTIDDEGPITLYRYCDQNNEWGNYIWDDIYIEYQQHLKRIL